MKKPLIQRRGRYNGPHARERGVTALVAASIVAMLAMAALSIDVASLYLANAEATARRGRCRAGWGKMAFPFGRDG